MSSPIPSSKSSPTKSRIRTSLLRTHPQIGNAGLQTGCHAGLQTRIGASSIGHAPGKALNRLEKLWISRSFERARLQPCRKQSSLSQGTTSVVPKRPPKRRALAPDEISFYKFNPFASEPMRHRKFDNSPGPKKRGSGGAINWLESTLRPGPPARLSTSDHLR